MSARGSSHRSFQMYLLLVIALSVPFWLIGAVAGQRLPLPVNLPLSALMAVCPLGAAVLLVYRDAGRTGVRRLLEDVVDYRRLKPKIWYVPCLALIPGIYLLSYGVMRLLVRPLPEPHISLLAIPLLFIGFFVAAACEEAGWTGYAVDPLRARWSALATGIVLGAVWGAWHVIPDIQAHESVAWIVWQRGVYDVALRVLLVWLYSNTGRAVLAAVLAHDTDNVSWALFPNNGSHYDPAIAGPITAVVALIVALLWGSRTLARYRAPVIRAG